MADTKVSALPAVTVPATTDEFPVNQGGTSKKVTLAQIQDANRAGEYDLAAVVIANEEFLLQYNRVRVSGTNRLTLAGTAEVVLSAFSSLDNVYMGQPRVPTTSWTVPQDWYWDLIARIALAGNVRGTLQGTGALILTDDFGTRSRIVLAGRGN